MGFDQCQYSLNTIRLALTDKNIMKSHTPPRSTIGRPPVPPILLPLTPAPVIPTPLRPRARTTIPETAIRKAAERSWTRQWAGLSVPPTIPGHGNPKTGWEGKGIVDNLRLLAGRHTLSDVTPLHLDMLPAHIRRIYPIKLKPKHVEQYPPPPPRATRQNPRTWTNPHRLTRRLVRRVYSRLWDSLCWIRPRGDSDQWEKCTYGELQEGSAAPEGRKKSSKDKKKQASARVAEYTKGQAADSQWL